MECKYEVFVVSFVFLIVCIVLLHLPSKIGGAKTIDTTNTGLVAPRHGNRNLFLVGPEIGAPDHVRRAIKNYTKCWCTRQFHRRTLY